MLAKVLTVTDCLTDSGILDNLTPDDVRQLVVSEDELATSQRFTRIFPTQLTHKYFRSVRVTLGHHEQF